MTMDNGSFSVAAYSCLFGVVVALVCGLIWVVLFWVVFELVLFALLFLLLTTLRFIFWILVGRSLLLRDRKLASSYKFLGWLRCLLRSCGS
jgi:biotin transporter BioY